MNYQRLLIVSFFSLIFLHSANAICVPRNYTHKIPSNSPSSSSSSRNKYETVSLTGAPTLDHISAASVSNKLLQVDTLSVPDTLQAFSVPKAINNAAIKKICDSTDHSDLCLSAISPYLDSKISATPASVLKIAIKASIEQTKLAISSISNMAGLPTTPADTISILKDCKDSYDDALDNFQGAMDSLLGGDIGTMSSMLSAAITDYGDCEDMFAEETSASPLVSHAEKLMKMVDNCLAISNLMK